MSKILIFNRSFFAVSETFIHRQVLSLSRHFDLVLMAFKFHNQDKFLQPTAYQILLNFFNGRIDHVLTFIARKVWPNSMPFSFSTAYLLRRIFKTERIDAIHAHYGWNGIAILSLAKRFKIPLVVSFHGVDASGLLRQKHYSKQLIPLFEYASSIVLCSSYMLKNLPLENFVNKVEIIPFGVDVNVFIPPEIPVMNKKLKILHAGRIVGKKGVPDLVRVFALLYEKYALIELHIIGAGKELEECKKVVQENNLEHAVFFFGPQSNAVVLQALRECDVFVLNSRTDDHGDQEGLPNALLEAMSCGKAVVSTFHAGIPDAVQNNYNGLLVEERSNSQLYEALEKLIQGEDLRRQLGKNARATIVNSFCIETMENRLKQVVTNVIKG
ncbi:glycosyltransferase [Chryseolinea sp. H1M3-3]|uniref:glycosyltransferase n=1 Tax=Chryseolinea sp. H1M3-3 TaxID=3034144 RepID=UPI0023EC12A6|nr:glycosyltransferase [Chryseolinea sp. H1M3-3]